MLIIHFAKLLPIVLTRFTINTENFTQIAVIDRQARSRPLHSNKIPPQSAAWKKWASEKCDF